MKLTVLVPGIRPEKWDALYNSIASACTYPQNNWEMIIISPYSCSDYLWSMGNVDVIPCWRSPIAAQQIGLTQAKGDYIAWCADDGICLPGTFDLAFEALAGKDYKHIIVGKYIEGDNPTDMLKGYYYCLNYHESMKLAGVPVNARLLNCGLVSRQLLRELGGWDAESFQVCPMAYNDLSVRALKYGASFALLEEPIFQCSWLPGLSGDHGPIHIAQTEYDEPRFKQLYSQETDRMVIDMNNWQKTEKKWRLRFGDEDNN